MTTKIAAIWAQDQNGLIENQSLPWHLPAELKHFKEITSGHAILMGKSDFRWYGSARFTKTGLVLF